MFDNEDRECKGCGFQNSCKEHIIRLNVDSGRVAGGVSLPQAPTTAYYQQYAAPSYAQPAPVPAPKAAMPAPVRYTPPAPVPTPVFQPRTIVQPPAASQTVAVQQVKPQQIVQQGHQQQIPMYVSFPPNYGQFGWYPDPVPAIMAANPAPLRPQMPGEGYGERVVKNLILGVLEVGLVVLLQGVRQYVWAPKAPAPPPPVVVPVP